MEQKNVHIDIFLLSFATDKELQKKSTTTKAKEA